MNEQFEALVKQCKETVESTEWPGEHWEQFNDEKFAQLIVRECALVIQDFVDHRIPASEYPERLKQHFGVAE